MARSKVTKKEVAAFVDDDSNWDVIPGNDYVRVGALDYGQYHFLVVFLKEVDNWVDVYIDKAEPEYQWRRQYYYEYDPDNKGITHGSSNTHIKELIYQEANK